MRVVKHNADTLDEYKKLNEKAISFLAEEANKGKPIVGAYCCYSPSELIYAMDGIPVGLCGTSNIPIAEAEKVLPANLCPLIKSSFGFIFTGTCPFFEISDAIIAETTCDGKKKMYELIQDQKPFHLLELPQMQDTEAAQEHWKSEVVRLKDFLEKQFDRKITDEGLENGIKEANDRRRLRRKLYEYKKIAPPLITGTELNRMFDVQATGSNYDEFIEGVIAELEKRKQEKRYSAPGTAPRVLLTGTPIGGDARKIIEEIEDAGGVVVVHEACSGVKPLEDLVEENTGDPLDAIARRYLKLACSCMTPNERRFKLLERLIGEYQVDCVIDAILVACHTYNVESFNVKRLAEKYNLPFLKIETDYSDSDRAQMRVRIETLLEMVRDSKIGSSASTEES